MRSYFTPQGNFYNESHRFAVGREWLAETEHSALFQQVLNAGISYAIGGTNRRAEIVVPPGSWRFASRVRMNPQIEPTSALVIHSAGAIIAPHREFPATTTELFDINNAPNGRTPHNFSGAITLANVSIGQSVLVRTGGAAAPTIGSWWLFGDDSTVFSGGVATSTKFRAFPVKVLAVNDNNITIDVACPWPLTTTPKLWPLTADASFGVQLLGLRFSGLYPDLTTRLDTPMRGYYMVDPILTDYEADDILGSGFQMFFGRGGLETNSRFIYNDPVVQPPSGTRRGSDVYFTYGWYRDGLYGEHTRHLAQSSANAAMTTRNGVAVNAWSASYDDHGHGSYGCIWEYGTFTQHSSATDFTGAKQGNATFAAEEFNAIWRDLTLNGCDLYLQAAVDCTFSRITARALGIGGFTGVDQGLTYPRNCTISDSLFQHNDTMHLGVGNSYKKATGIVFNYVGFIETATGAGGPVQTDVCDSSSSYTFNHCLFDATLAVNKNCFMQWASSGGSAAWTLGWDHCVFVFAAGSTGKSLHFNVNNSPTGVWSATNNVQRGNGAMFNQASVGGGLTYVANSGNVASATALSTPVSISEMQDAINYAITAGENP